MLVKTTEAYRDWINSLKDRAGRARIQVRVDRLVHGNPGQHRVLTGGVCELKIDVGPGYRVYYTERDGVLIVLLAGGTSRRRRRTSRGHRPGQESIRSSIHAQDCEQVFREDQDGSL